MAFQLRNAARKAFNVTSRITIPCRPLSTTSAAASSHGLTRLKEFYDSTLAEDLLVLTYDHAKAAPPTSKFPDIQAQIDRALAPQEEAPVKQVHSGAPRTRKGGKPVKPIPPLKSASTVPTLEKITVHAFVKEAVSNKGNLLSAFMAFQSITATRPEVVYARKSVASWKLR